MKEINDKILSLKILNDIVNNLNEKIINQKEKNELNKKISMPENKNVKNNLANLTLLKFARRKNIYR